MKLIKSRKTRNGGYKLAFSGELTIFNAANLKNELFPYVDKSKRLTLDFNGVSEADTSFLQILIQLKRACAGKNIDFSLETCSEPVASLIRTFRLADEFRIKQPKETYDRT